MQKQTVEDYILCCDDGFVGYTPDGNYVIKRGGHEAMVSPEQYWEEHPMGDMERFHAMVHINTNYYQQEAATSEDLLALLLDINAVVTKVVTGYRQLLKVFMNMSSEEGDYE